MRVMGMLFLQNEIDLDTADTEYSTSVHVQSRSGAWRNWTGGEQGHFMGKNGLIKVRVTEKLLLYHICTAGNAHEPIRGLGPVVQVRDAYCCPRRFSAARCETSPVQIKGLVLVLPKSTFTISVQTIKPF